MMDPGLLLMKCNIAGSIAGDRHIHDEGVVSKLEHDFETTPFHIVRKMTRL